MTATTPDSLQITTPTKPRAFSRRWLVLLAVIIVAAVSFIPVPGSSDKFQTPVDEAGGEVTVLIVDEKDNRIPGAKITQHALRSLLERASSWGWNEDKHGKRATVTSDKDGLAKIPYPKWVSTDGALLTGAVTLVVEHPDYCIHWNFDADVPQPGTAAAIPRATLKKGARLRITAFRDGDDKPLADFDSLISGQWFNGTWSQDGEALVSPVINPGEQVMMLVDRSDPKQLQFSELITVDLVAGKTEDLKVRLKPGARVKGRLTGVTSPVKNGFVIVDLMAKPNTTTYDEIEWMTWTPVTEGGEFEFSGLPPIDELRMVAYCDGYVSRMPAIKSLPTEVAQRILQGSNMSTPQFFSQQKTDVCEIQMEAAASADITVQDLKGQPIEGVAVNFYPNILFGAGSRMFGHAHRAEKVPPIKQTCMEYLQGAHKRWTDAVDPDVYIRPLFGGKTDANGKLTIANIPARGPLGLDVDHELLTVKGQNKPPFRSDIRVPLESGKTATCVVTMEPKPKLTPQMLVPPPPPTIPLYVRVLTEISKYLGL